mmetsp:Transcript_47893/g.94487  ORF Transcript_47893/g.94487 Transcript_47893/m.94487 type:complete len:211 (-) Transcript_47893:132-764(-)
MKTCSRVSFCLVLLGLCQTSVAEVLSSRPHRKVEEASRGRGNQVTDPSATAVKILHDALDAVRQSSRENSSEGLSESAKAAKALQLLQQRNPYTDILGTAPSRSSGSFSTDSGMDLDLPSTDSFSSSSSSSGLSPIEADPDMKEVADILKGLLERLETEAQDDAPSESLLATSGEAEVALTDPSAISKKEIKRTRDLLRLVVLRNRNDRR